MNSLEDRLRDAYRAATQTVQPESIRPLGERAGFAAPSPALRRRRLLAPMVAAASVAVIVVLTVVVPRAIGAGSRGAKAPVAGSPAGRYVVVSHDSPGGFLAVRNLLTGARSGRVRLPGGMYTAAVATGDGRRYLVVLWRPGVCRSWLYQFRLNDAGRPSALVPFTRPSIGQLLTPIAVSQDNATFAYLGERCSGNGRAPADLTVVTLATMRTRSWNIPKDADVASLSLTAHGDLLAYNVERTKLFRSAAYVLPANSAPGPALQRSRLVASGTQFGAAADIGSESITPDGSRLYFTTSNDAGRWQLRVADMRSGRTQVIGRYFGLPGSLAADPAVHRVLVVVQEKVAPPSPSPTPSLSPSGTPVPSPSASPIPSSSASPIPSSSASPVPSPSTTRVPSPSGSPVPSPSGSPVPVRAGLALIDLRAGTIQWLSAAAWDPATSSYAW